MRTAIATLLVLLLLASSASAKTICLIGDSLHLAGMTSLSVGLSPWRSARVIRELAKHAPDGDPWKDATVLDFSVPGTGPSDWLGPIDPSRCGNPSNPAAQRNAYPVARAACAAGDGMAAHLPVGVCDVFFLLGDVSEMAINTVTAEGTVDDIEALVAYLDTIDAGDGVVLSAPPLLETIAGTDQYLDVFDAGRAEMLERGIVNGPDLAPLRYLTAWDALHFRDSSHIKLGDGWFRSRPTTGGSE